MVPGTFFGLGDWKWIMEAVKKVSLLYFCGYGCHLGHHPWVLPSWWMCVCVCRERSDWNVSSGSRPDRSVTRQGLWPRPPPCRSRTKEHPAPALVTMSRHPLRLTIRHLTHLKSNSSSSSSSNNSTTTTSRDRRWRRRVAVPSATSTTPRHRSSTAPNSPTCYSRSVSSVCLCVWPLLFYFPKKDQIFYTSGLIVSVERSLPTRRARFFDWRYYVDPLAIQDMCKDGCGTSEWGNFWRFSLMNLTFSTTTSTVPHTFDNFFLLFSHHQPLSHVLEYLPRGEKKHASLRCIFVAL